MAVDIMTQIFPFFVIPYKITGANPGGPRQLAMRTSWAARVAQFCGWV